MATSRRKLITAAPLAAAAGFAAPKSQAPPTAQARRVLYPDGKSAVTEIPLYSEVITHGNTVYISGHGVNTSSDIRKQTAAVLDRIEKCLQTAGTFNAKCLEM